MIIQSIVPLWGEVGKQLANINQFVFKTDKNKRARFGLYLLLSILYRYVKFFGKCGNMHEVTNIAGRSIPFSYFF